MSLPPRGGVAERLESTNKDKCKGWYALSNLKGGIMLKIEKEIKIDLKNLKNVDDRSLLLMILAMVSDISDKLERT